MRYTVNGQAYVEKDVVYEGMHGEWSPQDMTGAPVYVNRLFPSWWRWHALPPPFSTAVFWGLSILFVLLWLRSYSKERTSERPNRDTASRMGTGH